MASFSLDFKPSVEKDLARIPNRIRQNIWGRILALCSNPHPSQSLKLSGTDRTWRLRVGDYRILYQIGDEQQLITVYAVKHRKEAYR